MSNGENAKTIGAGKIDWRTVIIFVSIAFSSQCGGGFAAGSTPWSYFFANTGFYGMLPEVTQPYFCLFMPFVVAAINCFMIYFFMKFAMDFRTFDYGNFLAKYGERFLGGKLAKPMQIVYEFNFNWLLIVCMALAYSSSGSALAELTGMPYLLTTFIVGIIMFVLCMKGSDMVRKNAVFMSAVIFVALIVVNVPNLFYNIASGHLTTEMAVMSDKMNAGIAAGAGSFIKYLLIAFAWAYIFSGQNLGGFGAYVNHAQLFTNKRTLRWAVVLSVVLNWAFLQMTVVNLAANYSEVYAGWEAGKAVYTILVVQNGVGSGVIKGIMLTLITVAIFFATISTAINYAQGFNDRVLNWYQKKINEAPEVSAQKRNKRGAVLTLVYICLTWGVSQAGLTALVSKGLTLVSFINLFTLIMPTIVNVVIGWPDADYSRLKKLK
ncbi:hypothetical protein [Clostridium sp. AN503]|uniref:hypothetical protein n=1 Tax=Clostridium sp. AN503 TaxID=3160598 RepID=UPI00345A1BA5